MRKKTLTDDPVVEEVRRIRAAIWQEAGGTPEGLIRLLDEHQARVKTLRPSKSKRRKRA